MKEKQKINFNDVKNEQYNVTCVLDKIDILSRLSFICFVLQECCAAVRFTTTTNKKLYCTAHNTDFDHSPLVVKP